MNTFIASPIKGAAACGRILPGILRRIREMSRKMFRNSYLIPGVKRVPAQVIERWGSKNGFHFPKDFVDFFVEFDGTILKEEYGYEFFYENNRGRDFAAIMVFLHFDPNVAKDSVEDQYTLRCTDHWDQRCLFPSPKPKPTLLRCWISASLGTCRQSTMPIFLIIRRRIAIVRT